MSASRPSDGGEGAARQEEGSKAADDTKCREEANPPPTGRKKDGHKQRGDPFKIISTCYQDAPLDLSLASAPGDAAPPDSTCGLRGAATGRTRGAAEARRPRALLPCAVCGKGFDRPSLLQRHARTHTGEKPHGCSECGKRFSTSSSLNTHRRIHSGERPHACPVCGKRFTASSNLYYHRMTHTKDKPHKCSLCGKSFPTPGDLRSHAYVHSGRWPFRCPVCNRGFSKHTNLRNHLILHTGNKPHGCRVCGKRFALSCNLRAHARTHDEAEGRRKPAEDRPGPATAGMAAGCGTDDPREAALRDTTATAVGGMWTGVMATMGQMSLLSTAGHLSHTCWCPSYLGDDQQVLLGLGAGAAVVPWGFLNIPQLLANLYMAPPDPFFINRCTQASIPEQGPM